jgi:hypothetical protein
MSHNYRQSNPGFSPFLEGLINGQGRTKNPGDGPTRKGKKFFTHIVSKPHVERGSSGGYVPTPTLPPKFLDPDLTRGRQEREREARRLAGIEPAKEIAAAARTYTSTELFGSLERYLKQVEEGQRRPSGDKIDLDRMLIVAQFIYSKVIPDALRIDGYADSLALKPMHDEVPDSDDINKYIKNVKRIYSQVTARYTEKTGKKIDTVFVSDEVSDGDGGNSYLYESEYEEESVEPEEALVLRGEGISDYKASPNTIKYSLVFLDRIRNYAKSYFLDPSKAAEDAHKAGTLVRQALLSVYSRMYSPADRRELRDDLTTCVHQAVNDVGGEESFW